MDNKYFSKFPIINYNGDQAVNIMRRVGMNDNIKNLLNVFYQYTAEKDDTVDNIAHNYYKDVDFDWLIYLANDITDPYYDVWMGDDVFSQFIVKKYGSTRNAQRKIVYYENNWRDDGRILTVSAYNALDDGLKKYWTPIDNTVSVIGYERSKIDFRYSTNKIISYDFTADASAEFAKDDIVYVNSDSATRATVSWANTSSVVLRHVEGTFSTVTNFTLTSDSVGVVATANASSYANFIDFTDANGIPVENVIPVGEEVYFSKVVSYDEELTLNDRKRNLYLVDVKNKSALNKQLRELMK